VTAKNILIELVQKSFRDELNFISRSDHEQLNAVGTKDHWASKDVIAHNAAWKVMMSEALIATMGNQEPPSYDDLDAFNEEIFQRHQKKSWKEVKDFMEMTNLQLLEQIHLVDEEILLDPERYDWLKGRSLWKRTIHNGYFHPLGHIAFLYSERGDSELGNQLMEEITHTLLDLDESSPWQGQCLYNLACYYALSGEKEKSIENLSQAFSLSSDIIEWSQTDTDLESIWDDPGYRALVGNK